MESYGKSLQQQFFEIIRSLTGQSNILTVPRVLIDFTGGSIESALFLSQLLFWSDKTTNDGWIYKSYREWKEEIHITRYALDQARKALEGFGILETQLKKVNGGPTVHYRLNIEAFVEQFNNFIQEKERKEAESIENTGFAENNKWFCRNQQKVLLKTTNGFAENNKTSNTEITTKIMHRNAHTQKGKLGQKPRPDKYEKFYL